MMDKKVTGAWLLHHDQKLLQTNTVSFEAIAMAGRSARLLSVISKEHRASVDNERIQALATGLGIRKLEVAGLIDELSSKGFVEKGQSGVSILGVSQQSLLGHAADIFDAQKPNGLEKAALDLAERGSHSPLRRSDCEEEIADTHKLAASELDDLFGQSEQIGFTDYEGDAEDRLYFNGSLFKRDHASKAKNVLESLKPDESARLVQAEGVLQTCGCMQVQEMRQILGDPLWQRLHQIAYFEVSVVTNESGQTEFVTKPEAIAKFMPNGLADMLDDAKALAASLTYGIVLSNDRRGRIRDPNKLIKAFLGRGYLEGRAEALSQDYKILERRGVVSVSQNSNGYRLTLDKPEIGRMAQALILKGDATQVAVEEGVGQSSAQYAGPESSRQIERKRVVPEVKSDVSKALNILRRG